MAKLRDELQLAKWHRIENDLYSLNQTHDIANFDEHKSPTLHKFRVFMHQTVKRWLQEATGVELNERVAITGSDYREADLLLPHDDRLEERKFAFVFYLSPEWREEYGGLLHLYDSIPEENRPSKIAKTIFPGENAFVFFQVKVNSWHAVSEVVAKDKSRLSLNGWFHMDNTPPAPEPKPEVPLARTRPGLDVTVISFLLNILYKNLKKVPKLKNWHKMA